MMTIKPGTNIALRGMYNHRPWYVESAIVVKDTPQEVALLVAPGAECAAPPEYIHGKHGESHQWDRWGLMSGERWQLERYRWHTNRFLVLLESGKFYSINYIWNDASDAFLGYYVNFQLPFERSQYGFDTFDLELDLVIDPELRWRWKDFEEYQQGIAKGCLRPEWGQGVEQAKADVFARLEGRLYPFDGTWFQWRPNPAWAASHLPEGWDTKRA